MSNPPATIKRGASFAVTDTVTNQGGSTAGASTTRYFLSTDAVKSSGDPSLTGSRAVPALAAGASSTGTVTIRVPKATPAGTYVLIACADQPSVVAESNEGNNCLGAAATVKVTR